MPDPLVDPLPGLDEAQRACVERTRGPLCILAGAGSGKTRTITHRIAYQVLSGVARHDQLLAVTFTDKAAGELRGRLARMGLPGPVRAATFHAAAWAQLRWFWPRVDDAPLPDVLTSKIGLLVPAARRARVTAQDLAAEIEWAKARRISPEAYPDAACDRGAPLGGERMAAVYAGYERAKADAGLLDYEDMLLRCADLLNGSPEVAAEVRDRYRFFTVDEFQDVNPAQRALLRAWLGDRDELCVVGDDDQAIYSFTGATSAYLTGFRDHFPRAPVLALPANYRSSPQVIALANRVLWTKPGRRRQVARGRSGPPPVFRELADDAAEVAAVVEGVRRLLASGVPAGEIAVCYRVNSQSEAFELALRAAGVPYVVRGDVGFYQRREVVQALGVLRVAAEEPPRPPPAGLEDTIAARRPRADDALRRALRARMGWDERREPDGAAARERWRNLSTLAQTATRIVDERPDATLADVVDALQQRAAAGVESPDPSGAVTLLTFHRAKGLEFDAVFLVGLEEGLLPISHARSDDAVEEERRLLYVGITRARRHLFLSWVRRRTGPSGRAAPRRPSRLLYNLAPGAPRAGGRRATGRGRPAARGRR